MVHRELKVLSKNNISLLAVNSPTLREAFKAIGAIELAGSTEDVWGALMVTCLNAPSVGEPGTLLTGSGMDQERHQGRSCFGCRPISD
jgi:hypothetical protein